MEATYAGVSSAEGASEIGAALLGVACAIVLRAALEPVVDLSHTAITFFVFLSAAVVVAAVVGFSPALLTLVFGALAAWFLFVPPRYTFPVSDLTAVSSLGIYLLSGPGIAYLASSYRAVTINAATAREMTARVERLERELAERAGAETTPASIEERFRTPADEMKGAAIYLLDDRGHNATWNKGVRRLLGYEKAEFLQRTVSDVFPPEDRAAGVPERELAVAREQGRASSERWLVRKDGSRFWASASLASVHGRNNQVVGYACTLRDLTGLKQVEEELRRHREALALAHEAAGLGAWQFDVAAAELRCDNRARTLLGISTDAPVSYGAWAAMLHPDDRASAEELWHTALHERQPFSAEYRVVWPDGSIRWLAALGRATSSARTGDVDRITGVVLDITERKHSEERLQEVLRLEAVGRLAGGIAHDLNNMLAAILGFSDFLAQSLSPDDHRRGDVEQIAQAANRSASLTRQLLAFARRELIQPRRLDVNKIVRRAEAMLRPVLGPNVELVLQLADDIGVVFADAGQVEQILMNLVLNARDAMPQGGRLTVETMSLVLGRANVPPQLAGEVPAMGRYLMLSVSDTGHGMDPHTLAHIWEPFFTTKPVGQGTGLGLSAVYGAVKQSGGFVWAESEPGRGTVIGVYWPELPAGAEPVVEEPAEPVVERGSETIIIVDDEPLVRALALRTLGTAGYRCREAGDADEALRVVSEEERVDLIVTDVVMPGLSGGALGERLAALRPDIQLLYTSGFAGDDVIRRGLMAHGLPFLQKPFTPGDLARAVREVLDARSRLSAPSV
ncbi:MAG TPA: PAS domain S-box protein [Gemmatimonadales bacterium]|nr:PAS domain S-box protein [Gemmatimonadales bacterium]